MWSIYAHPSILGSKSSLLWQQKLVPTRSAIFTSPLPVYKATRPMKTMAIAMTFYFYTQLCYYAVYFSPSFYFRLRAVPAMATKNGSNQVCHLYHPATHL